MNPNIARRIAFHKAFDDVEIHSFLYDEGEIWRLGTVDENDYNPTIRSVYAKPVALEGLFYEKLKSYVWSANKALWNFDLTGLSPHDPPQLLRYERGDHYEWHLDHDSQSSTRKLTCIVQLSDADSYKGGDVCVFPPLSGFSPSDWRACGTLIIFPVYVPHCIAKIEAGTRHALVFWVHGPAFR